MMYGNGGFFTIKDDSWLENQRKAGKVLSAALSLAEAAINEGVSTSYIDKICEDYILDNNCIPTFKNYIGFPATTCVSINEEIVHGIPKKDIYLKYGDIVKVDCGATYKGVIADSAISVVVGDYLDSRHKDLLKGCKKCLDGVIDLINNRIGNITLGDVGYYIKKEANKIGANIIKELTGHGLELDTLHWYPQILNYGNKNEGITLIPNMTICIEPIFIFGPTNISIKSDKYTIITPSIGVHWEHTIFIHNNCVEILTKRDNEKIK